ncbi:MAG TPA: citramalate synthase [Kofleriaceae bacterium]|nr:citramalate synthase [Kofleriaceae bacterium]
MKLAGDSSPGGVPGEVLVYDTTLRDGTQREGISLSCEDKLRIARRLDQIGVSMIEGGWPGSNPKDAELFARARDVDWRHARLAAFGATRRAGIAIEDDASVAALLAAETPVCTIFGKSWTLHVREVLRASLDENLALVGETVAYLRAHGRRVVFDAEHFFDGHAADAPYALEVVAAAARAGAEAVVLCDTNGGRLPWEVEGATAAVLAALGPGGPAVGIHTHDDGGCAVANALAAVAAGATHVQGTINGYGERCGNADLCALLPTLELKMGRRCLPPGALPGLAELARFVAEVANLPPDEHQPYVGRCAFAHKGGVHVSAVRRCAGSYEHVAPEAVGNRTRVVVSELSGRANLLAKAEEFGLELAGEDPGRALAEIKEGEARGLSFEAAEASVALLLRRRSPAYAPPFRLVEYRVMTGFQERLGNWAEATIKITVGAEVIHAVAEGNGPVHALDGALRKALWPAYPEVADIRLTDYRVRILDSQSATAAITRVLIDSSDGARRWSTVGAGTDILAASWAALADSFEYGLTETAEVIGRDVEREGEREREREREREPEREGARGSAPG